MMIARWQVESLKGSCWAFMAPWKTTSWRRIRRHIQPWILTLLVDTQNCQIATGGTLPIPNHNFWSPYWIFRVYFLSLYEVWAPWACCNIPGRNASQGNRRNHRKHACKDNTLLQRIRSAGSLLLDWAPKRSNQMMVWGVVPCVRRENTLNPTYTTYTGIFCKFILAGIWSSLSCGN